MTSMDDLVTWLRAALDDDERVAKEASRHQHGDGWTPTGEHWHWVEPDGDQVLPLDPVLDEYLNEAGRADLRSVEHYPSGSGNPWSLPHFVMSTEETRTVDAMHIVRWDPARVLAEVEAKRRILAHIGMVVISPGREALPAEYVEQMELFLRWLAQPYADQPGYREEWRP